MDIQTEQEAAILVDAIQSLVKANELLVRGVLEEDQALIKQGAQLTTRAKEQLKQIKFFESVAG